MSIEILSSILIPSSLPFKYPSQTIIMATNDSRVQTEKVNSDIITLTRSLTEKQVKHDEANGHFT
jgi:hypothetical protein